MPPQATPEAREPFTPNPATLVAWETQAFMLEFKRTEPGSAQAEVIDQRIQASFANLVSLTQAKTRTIIAGSCPGRPQDAEDVLQEVYIRAFKGLPRLKGDSQVETWLYRITHNELARYHHRRARYWAHHTSLEVANDDEDLLEATVSSDPLDDPTHQVEASEEFERIMDGVNQLQPRRYAAVMLRGYFDHSYEAVGEFLGTSAGSARILFMRGRREVADHLSPLESEE